MKATKICYFEINERWGNLLESNKYITIIDVDGNSLVLIDRVLRYNIQTGYLRLQNNGRYQIMSYAEYHALILLNPLFNTENKEVLDILVDLYPYSDDKRSFVHKPKT